MAEKQRLTRATHELEDASNNQRKQFVPGPRVAPGVKEIASRNPAAPVVHGPDRDDDDPGPTAA